MRPSCLRTAGPPGRARMPLALLALALLVLWSSIARAGTHAFIPPGQEERIRALVDDTIASANEAEVVPVELDARVDIRVDRDHFWITLHPAPDPRVERVPQLLVFHPDSSPAIEGAIAPAIFARCGDRACTKDELDPWRAFAAILVQRRAPDLGTIWRVEAEDEPGPDPTLGARSAGPVDEDEARRVRAHYSFDRVAIVVLVGLGLALAILAWSTGRERPSPLELLALAGLLAAFVGATLAWTPLLPLHEHNSFIARADCAADPHCLDDPIAAWNLSALNGYSVLLELVPPSAAGLSALSLGLSCVSLIVLWALARALMGLLGRPELGALAGLGAVLVLATHPVAWRLAGSASFWPWSLVWTLGAALAGVWAAGVDLADPDEPALRRAAAACAWLLASGCLAVAVGGNFVLLTLGPALVLAPLLWTGLGSANSSSKSAPRIRARALALALFGASLAIFAVLASVDYEAGLERVAGESIGERLSWPDLARGLPLLLGERRVGTIVWAPAMLAALAWLVPRLSPHPAAEQSPWRALRVLAPLAYLAALPSVFLLVAAGELIGSGYPVGFINHHWELWWSALAAGFGLAWIAATLDERWALGPLLAAKLPRVPRVSALRWDLALPLVLGLWAGVRNPMADEGWAMASGSRLVERELVALEQAFTRLPAHDLLIIPPRLLEPETDAPTQWDPIEVNFPVRAYQAAMRARGLEPAPITPLDRLELQSLDPGQTTLIYVGTSLRSFQPHEISADAVPEEFERRELRRLRQTHDLQAIEAFRLRGEQHPAISLRLAGDRVPELELGFYALRKTD